MIVFKVLPDNKQTANGSPTQGIYSINKAVSEL